MKLVENVHSFTHRCVAQETESDWREWEWGQLNIITLLSIMDGWINPSFASQFFVCNDTMPLMVVVFAFIQIYCVCNSVLNIIPFFIRWIRWMVEEQRCRWSRFSIHFATDLASIPPRCPILWDLYCKTCLSQKWKLKCSANERNVKWKGKNQTIYDICKYVKHFRTLEMDEGRKVIVICIACILYTTWVLSLTGCETI